MEITEKVIKEQEQRKEQERIWESRYELRYGEQTNAGEGQDVVAWTMINRILSQNKAHTSPQYLNVLNHGSRKMKGICCFCFYKHHTRLK